MKTSMWLKDDANRTFGFGYGGAYSLKIGEIESVNDAFYLLVCDDPYYDDWIIEDYAKLYEQVRSKFNEYKKQQRKKFLRNINIFYRLSINSTIDNLIECTIKEKSEFLYNKIDMNSDIFIAETYVFDAIIHTSAYKDLNAPIKVAQKAALKLTNQIFNKEVVL